MIAYLIQITLSIALASVVLLQGSTAGIGAAFGGTSNYHTKRGLEKSLFYLTIALSIAFTGSSIALLI